MTQFNEGKEETLKSKSGSQRPAMMKKTLLITIVVGLVLISAMWIWKTMEISSIRKDADIEKQAVQEQASRQLVQAHEEHLKLLAKPFVWAVRSEMMQGNISQVNLYMNDMVKEKNIERIALLNEKGIIISSTNKKDEGKPFSTIGDMSTLVKDTTMLANQQDSVISMTSPVMGFNNRIGTLFIKYSIPKSQ
jgi:hypothetical protein